MPEKYGNIKSPSSLKNKKGVGTAGTKKNLDMRGQPSVTGVNETSDVRKHGISADTRTSQFKRELNREVNTRAFNHAGEARSNAELHSDTTQPGDTEVVGRSLPTWADSGDRNVKRQKSHEYDGIKKESELSY